MRMNIFLFIYDLSNWKMEKLFIENGEFEGDIYLFVRKLRVISKYV